ncbi:MAG: hypothetical protein L6R38_007499 [Xanthoria sp. 2 TBL-2021]|nr:MAG: hypothetical protein L6R38_007499 [Xanthoria sp. 2 TBL-2021]
MATPDMTTGVVITPEEILDMTLHWNDDRSQQVIIITTVFTICATTATVARLVTRRVIAKIPTQLDDYAIIIATVTFALEITYNLYHLAVKASLLLLYKAVLTLANRTFRIAWYAVGSFAAALYTACFFASIFQCSPVNYSWEKTQPGHCFDLKTSAIATAALSALSDVSLLVLPIPILWGLQMPLKRKLALISIFSLGGLYGIHP